MDPYEALSKLAEKVFSGKDYSTNMPFYPFLVNQNGTIDKNGLITELLNWIDGSTLPEEDKRAYKDALNKSRKDKELFNALVGSIAAQLGIRSNQINIYFIAHFWTFYGIAIRKCIGTKAQKIDETKYCKEYKLKAGKVKTASEKCIRAYNITPAKKSDPDSSLDALKYIMPTIRSANRKVRTIKKHVNITKKKAKRIIEYRSIFTYLIDTISEFNGGVNVVPDQFADYTLENSNIH